MHIKWTKQAAAEFTYWRKHDGNIVKRIQTLLFDIIKTPYQGIGKPEPLKFALSGKWSRRINHEHRLVYSIENGEVIIYQCRFHYGK